MSAIKIDRELYTMRKRLLGGGVSYAGKVIHTPREGANRTWTYVNTQSARTTHAPDWTRTGGSGIFYPPAPSRGTPPHLHRHRWHRQNEPRLTSSNRPAQ